jgi:hypothetical protein
MGATWTPLTGRSARAVFTTASESAPTLATEGVNLNDVSGFIIYAEADSGQTFTATTGSFLAYLWDDFIQAWARAPGFDFSIATGSVGTRRHAEGGWTVSSPRPRLAHVPSSVAVSSGGVTLTYACSSLWGERT